MPFETMGPLMAWDRVFGPERVHNYSEMTLRKDSLRAEEASPLGRSRSPADFKRG
jgi:hypothetical protein